MQQSSYTIAITWPTNGGCPTHDVRDTASVSCLLSLPLPCSPAAVAAVMTPLTSVVGDTGAAGASVAGSTTVNDRSLLNVARLVRPLHKSRSRLFTQIGNRTTNHNKGPGLCVSLLSVHSRQTQELALYDNMHVCRSAILSTKYTYSPCSGPLHLNTAVDASSLG